MHRSFVRDETREGDDGQAEQASDDEQFNEKKKCD